MPVDNPVFHGIINFFTFDPDFDPASLEKPFGNL